MVEEVCWTADDSSEFQRRWTIARRKLAASAMNSNRTANADRIQKTLAKELAGIEERKREQLTSEIADYFGKVFNTEV